MNKESLEVPVEKGQWRPKVAKNGRVGPMFELLPPSNGKESGDRETDKGDNDNAGNDQQQPSLTPGQELALPALLTCPTIRAAAKQAGVSERSMRRWMHEDEHFQRTLRQLRNEALGQAATHLQQGAIQAVGAMYDLIDSDRLIETGRATLIRTALDFAFRSGAYGDLADRIADLEKSAPGDKND